MKRLFVLVCVLCLAVGSAMAEEATVPPAERIVEPAVKTVSAVGKATVSAKADTAVLVLGVKAEGESLSEAQQSADEAVAAVKAALTEKGVPVSAIDLIGYEVQTLYHYQYGKLGDDKQTPSGYTVSADVQVRIARAESVSEVVDTAVASGADSSYMLRFESSAYETAYAEALAAAVENAARKAQVLSTASELALGEILRVEEREPTVDDADRELAVTATVEVTFAAQP